MKAKTQALAVAGAVFVVAATYSLLRWWQFGAAGYDLGIFDQVVRAYAHFQRPIVTLKGDDFNIWGDHFHPILALLAPLYWVWDDPRMLLLAQAALVALSVPVVHAFAARRFSSRLATLISIGYGFGWGIQSMIDFDFHEIAFGVPLIALAIDALDRRSDWVLLGSCTALLFVREDLGMTVMLIGLIRVFRRPRWPGAVLLVLGPAAFMFITKVVLPYFSPTGKFAYWAYDALGPDATSSILYMLANPIATVVLFFTPTEKLFTFVLFFAPGIFLAFRSPLVLLSAPILAQRFFASRDTLWRPYFHYNAPVWVIAVLASVDGVCRIRASWVEKNRPWLARSIFAWAIIPTMTLSTVTPYYRFITGSIFVDTNEMHGQRALVAQIPAGTCVEADDRLAVRLVRTNRITLPGLGQRPPDFLALDLSQQTVGTSPDPYPRVNYLRAKQDGWIEQFRDGSLVLLRNPDYTGPSPRCLPQ